MSKYLSYQDWLAISLPTNELLWFETSTGDLTSSAYEAGPDCRGRRTIGEILQAWMPWAKNICRRLCRSQDDAEDLALEAMTRFLIAYTKEASDGARHIMGKRWLFRICTRAFLDALRVNRRRIKTVAGEIEQALYEGYEGDPEAHLRCSRAAHANVKILLQDQGLTWKEAKVYADEFVGFISAWEAAEKLEIFRDEYFVAKRRIQRQALKTYRPSERDDSEGLTERVLSYEPLQIANVESE